MLSNNFGLSAVNLELIEESYLFKNSSVCKGVSGMLRVFKKSSKAAIKLLLVCCIKTLLSPSNVSNGSLLFLKSPNLLAKFLNILNYLLKKLITK